MKLIVYTHTMYIPTFLYYKIISYLNYILIFIDKKNTRNRSPSIRCVYLNYFCKEIGWVRDVSGKELTYVHDRFQETLTVSLNVICSLSIFFSHEHIVNELSSNKKLFLTSQFLY